MSNFDQTFESTRLAMLAKQHPDIVKEKGKVVFRAEDDEDLLCRASWRLEDDVFDQATESGFKLLLMELIDIFSFNTEASAINSREKKGLFAFVLVKLVLNGCQMVQLIFLRGALPSEHTRPMSKSAECLPTICPIARR